MDHDSLHARNTHEFPAGAFLISQPPLKQPGKPQRDVTGNTCTCHRQRGSPKAWPPAAILFYVIVAMFLPIREISIRLKNKFPSLDPDQWIAAAKEVMK